MWRQNVATAAALIAALGGFLGAIAAWYGPNRSGSPVSPTVTAPTAVPTVSVSVVRDASVDATVDGGD